MDGRCRLRPLLLLGLLATCSCSEDKEDPPTAEEKPAISARVSGRVLVEAAGQRFVVPNATVIAESAGFASQEVRADSGGKFTVFVDAMSDETLSVCARAAGFITRCADVSVSPEEGTDLDIILASEGQLIFGLVLNSDGAPCSHDSPSFGLAWNAEIAVDGTSVGQTDSVGRYVIGGLTVGSHTIRATCQTLSADIEVTLSDAGRSSGPFDLELLNRSPVITSLTASDSSGRVVRHPTPGQVVTLKVRASDPDRDPVSVGWHDETGVREDSSRDIAWNLPAVSAQNSVTVEVRDEKGGVASRDLWLPTSAEGPRFRGRVQFATTDVPSDLRVEVNGESVAVMAGGTFRTSVPEAQTYVLTAYATGKSIAAQVLDSESTEVELSLHDADVYTVDPNEDVLIQADDGSYEIVIPAASLVDLAGVAATSTLSASVYRFPGADRVPGGRVWNNGGATMSAEPLAALSILVTDSDGNRYDLTTESSADVVVRVPDEEKDPCDLDPLSTPTAGTIAQVSGQWEAGGASVQTQADGSFATQLKLGLSIIGKARPITCVRLAADRGSILVPLRVKLERYSGCKNDGGVPIYRPDRELVVSDYDFHVLDGLIPGGHYRMTVMPTGITGSLNFDGRPLTHEFNAPTQAAADAYPFEACEDRPDLLRRYQDRVSYRAARYDSGTSGASYYQRIGAYRTRATFQDWLTVNGFDQDDGVTARFYNAAELAVGREVTCRNDGGKFACYIVKYGAPGGPVSKALDDLIHKNQPGDTVAIDVDSSDGALRFYAYGPDGELKTETKFREGQAWPMPGACYGCHWVTESQRGVLVSVDPNTHIYAEELPRSSQEESIRRINAMVAQRTGQTTRTTRDYIKLLYPNGVNQIGAVAQDAVQPAWSGTAALRRVYKTVVRNHCQVCHLGVRPVTQSPDTQSLTNFVCGYDVSFGETRFWGYDMPGSWVSHRNLWQGFGRVNDLRQVTGDTGQCDLLANDEVKEPIPD